jgi:putative tryptophan/tyrosine transport system substrate-binding protein
MKRRQFITGLAGAAAWPRAARAQQPPPVIGFLSVRSSAESADLVAAFRAGLAESRIIEGKDLTIAFRWADGRFEDLPKLATDLVQQQVKAIAAVGGAAPALAARAASSAIPIVFVMGTNPVELGLVNSLPRPGGNVTGVTVLTFEIISKRLEFLHQVVPGIDTVALLVNPASPATEAETKEAEIAARKLGLRLLVLNATNHDEIVGVFEQLARRRNDPLIVSGDGFFTSQREKIAALAANYAVPTMYAYREYVQLGGLMSYGSHLPDGYRLAGVYAGRIFKGEKPADLPVQQSTKFELAINLKTAKALGLTIPETLLATADEVIQ